MTQENLMISIDVLRKEVEVLTSRLGPAGTGYLYTTIDTLNSRIDELIEEVTAPYWKDEDGDIGRLPGQTRASHLRSIEAALVFDEEDVYDGYLEENERMEAEALSILAEQSRLSKIQDKAAGRSKEVIPFGFVDERIKADAMSDDYEHTKEYYDRGRNRPMEGQDFHLEPLPINTFK